MINNKKITGKKNNNSSREKIVKINDNQDNTNENNEKYESLKISKDNNITDSDSSAIMIESDVDLVDSDENIQVHLMCCQPPIDYWVYFHIYEIIGVFFFEN